MSVDAFTILRRWLEAHPNAEACAALAALELDVRDRERVLRFVNGRRIPAWQRVRERELVRQYLEQFRRLHTKPSMRSARKWIARASQLPPSRVRQYLQQLAAETVRNSSSTLSAADALTVPCLTREI